MIFLLHVNAIPRCRVATCQSLGLMVAKNACGQTLTTAEVHAQSKILMHGGMMKIWITLSQSLLTIQC